MWRLWHRLFGWHYASVEFGYDMMIRRVEADGDGEPYVVVCGRYISLKDPGYRQWRPLTFRRDEIERPNRNADLVVFPGGKA